MWWPFRKKPSRIQNCHFVCDGDCLTVYFEHPLDIKNCTFKSLGKGLQLEEIPDGPDQTT